MRIKAYKGKDDSIREMSQANKLALVGDYQQADLLYEKMLMNHPNHPGILFNQGMGHNNGQDSQNGVHYLSKSIKASSNYLPSLRFMYKLQQATQSK